MKDTLDAEYSYTCKKALDYEIDYTVDYEIYLAKLNHCGVCGVLNDWFRSYLFNRQQYVSIYGYESGLTKINCGVPQALVLGPLLFLPYTNDLNEATKFCKVHHLEDDTNLSH